jgi:hypothetical protein
MVFEASAVDYGIALLLAVALAEYFKWRSKSEGFKWLAVGGIWLLFAGSFVAAPSLGAYIGATAWSGIAQIFEILGWLFALIGTLFIAYETLLSK